MGFMSTVSGFLPESLPEGAGKGSFYELKTKLPGQDKVLEFVSVSLLLIISLCVSLNARYRSPGVLDVRRRC